MTNDKLKPCPYLEAEKHALYLENIDFENVCGNCPNRKHESDPLLTVNGESQ
jgi:hypothetical protein